MSNKRRKMKEEAERESMAFNPQDYHPEWQSIRRQILEQADHKCEFCGVHNYAKGRRDLGGDWHDEAEIRIMPISGREEWFGDPDPKMIGIVLTIAHLCHDKMCVDPTHLRALCQRCHLHYDMEARRERKKAEAAA